MRALAYIDYLFEGPWQGTGWSPAIKIGGRVIEDDDHHAARLRAADEGLFGGEVSSESIHGLIDDIGWDDFHERFDVTDGFVVNGKFVDRKQAAEMLRSKGYQDQYLMAQDLDLKKYEAVLFETPLEQTPAFKKWFSGSKIVDEDGAPLKVYHGTANEFYTFDVEGSYEGALYFTPNRNTAEAFANPLSGDNPHVKEVYLSIRNPKIIPFHRIEVDGGTDQGKMYLEFQQARKDGHDGVILTGVPEFGGNSDQYVAFNSNQIKSATGNSGMFNLDNPDIREAVQLNTKLYGYFGVIYDGHIEGRRVDDVVAVDHSEFDYRGKHALRWRWAKGAPGFIMWTDEDVPDEDAERVERWLNNRGAPSSLKILKVFDGWNSWRDKLGQALWE